MVRVGKGSLADGGSGGGRGSYWWDKGDTTSRPSVDMVDRGRTVEGEGGVGTSTSRRVG